MRPCRYSLTRCRNTCTCLDYWRNCYWPRAIQRATAFQQQSGCCTTATTTATDNHEQQQQTTTMTADEALQTILSTKLIVGFHPDQATEACFDLALLLRVPYCVVPCCVFPSEFPHRRLSSNGRRVKSYDEFIQYLQDKYEPRRATLKFHHEHDDDASHHKTSSSSRNVVLYRLPQDISNSE